MDFEDAGFAYWCGLSELGYSVIIIIASYSGFKPRRTPGKPRRTPDKKSGPCP